MHSSVSQIPPASSRLPLELLQQIYYLLPPVDFDAARHTCRLWLFASLDKGLLKSQLILGGWQAGAEQDFQEAVNHFRSKSRQTTSIPAGDIDSSYVSQSVGAEWILSKRLAAETRFCPEWRCIWPSDSSNGTQALVREMAVNAIKAPTIKPPSVRGANASILPASCTVSGCSKFVLLAQDRVVFIYSLQSFKAGMRPLTSILCHRRIVNVSMDTSCGRYALGILLEGRIGMCCDLNMGKYNSPNINRIHPSMSLSDFRNFDVRTTSRPRSLINEQDHSVDLFPPTRSRSSPRADSYGRGGHPLGRSGDAIFVRESSLTLTDSNSHNASGEEFNPPNPNGSFNQFFPERFADERANQSLSQRYPFNNFDPITGTSVPIELGARKIYKNLCNIHDPPKSVAICPQRQCVAFGSRAGVELHWIDALRGSTLSRYFECQG